MARPRVSVKLQNGRAIFRSDRFAWRVCLDLDGEQRLPDNFFDIFPGIPPCWIGPAASADRESCASGTWRKSID